ncbi:MAG: hypothetical protein MMC33_009275 [Icmadophila ericetorum]|nr:hypothetical protein [Icmadophila ericetorum]
MAPITRITTELLLNMYRNLPSNAILNLSSTSRQFLMICHDYKGLIYEQTVTEVHDKLVEEYQDDDRFQSRIQFAGYSEFLVQKAAKVFIRAEYDRLLQTKDWKPATANLLRYNEDIIAQTIYQVWLCHLFHEQNDLFNVSQGDDDIKTYFRLSAIYRMHLLAKSWEICTRPSLEIMGFGRETGPEVSLTITLLLIITLKSIRDQWFPGSKRYFRILSDGDILPPDPFRDDWEPSIVMLFGPEYAQFLADDELLRCYREIERDGIESDQDPRPVWAI